MGKLHKIRKAVRNNPDAFRGRGATIHSNGVVVPTSWHSFGAMNSYQAFVRHVLYQLEPNAKKNTPSLKQKATIKEERIKEIEHTPIYQRLRGRKFVLNFDK